MHFDPKLMPRSCVAFSLIPLIYPQTLPDDPRTIIEVANELASEKFGQSQAIQLFNLGRVHQKLESKCHEIQTNTSGVWAFFRYFLNSRALTEQKTLLEEAKNVSLYIVEVVKAAPSLETDSSTEEEPIESPASDMQENNAIESDEALATEKPKETPPEPTPPPPQRAEGTPEVPTPTPPGETPGGPPPPPPAPPMENQTLSSSQSHANISSEEKHIAREKDRLNRGLKERANPDVFFSSYPPKNERELNERKQEIVKDIEKIKKYDDAAWLEEKESALAKITEQLKPQKIMLQYANPQQRPQFNTKVSKYTNEELRIIIGIMFNGNAPEINHPAYSYYACNQAILDKIFKDWKQISSGEKGKAFLMHEEEWKRNLQSNLFGFILTLRNRMLPEKHREYLSEPTYQITPYGKKKEMKVPSGSDKMPVTVIEELRHSMRKKGKNAGDSGNSSK